MNTSDTSTEMMLLFFSFKLIFATTRPSAHDSTSTNTEISSTDRIPPTTIAAEIGTTTQYTITAGTMMIAEYISPIR